MCKALLLSVILVFFPRGVGAEEPNKADLRDAIRLPRVVEKVSCFDIQKGIFQQTSGEKPNLAAEIAKVREELKGDEPDLHRYRVLGCLYRTKGEKEKSEEAFGIAIEGYRQAAARNPDDYFSLYILGVTLVDLGQLEDGATALRRAINLNPELWYIWAALGDSCLWRAAGEVLGGTDVPHERCAYRLGHIGSIFADRASDREVRSRRSDTYHDLLKKAQVYFDQAVKIAPDDPNVYSRRAISRIIYSDIASGLRGRLCDKFPTEAVADFQEAANKNPRDYRAYFTAVAYEILCNATSPEAMKKPRGENWMESLPDSTQRSVKRGTSKLRELTQSEDKQSAAGAWESLGLLEMMTTFNRELAIDHFRQAVELDPTRGSSWEFLVDMLEEDGRFKAALEYGEKSLLQKDCSRRRILVAQACHRLGKFDQAEEYVRAALKDAPKDFRANLSLAALLLHKANDDVALAEAGEQLYYAWQLLSPDDSSTCKHDYDVTRSIHLALTNQLGEARMRLDEVVKTEKHHRSAELALKALGK
jgi:tetratricopeptide (TPR) repeat protein